MVSQNIYPKIFRPWGYYQDMFVSDSSKVKEVVVRPGASLSLQLHEYRSEHWRILQGIAKARCGSREFYLKPGESAIIPAGEIHRIENVGKVDLVFIEIQTGIIIDENDIIRLEDKYNREVNLTYQRQQMAVQAQQ